MNTTSCASEKKVARVAIDVRLYFDVPIESEDPVAIKCAARKELERVADEELIRVKRLKFPNIYPIDAWHTVLPEDFQICQTSAAEDANRETRFAL